ncbi:ribonucleotide-diphosphate reductase subunit alpha [Bacillus coahuilensis m2-6]|uniref:ribonucleoside-diphosphate reductase subunit alpha n=1 Tax=Bacillus coahuilensis TaxID=408580 RepID=UPI0007502C00|nr:ribonucleoside-diphosphate reductase subunit alpha [Bacillus coahuilensis]KUP08166.1 ribonucleotide-diphosphate reductase subunit alpha [Bacillus coahuilensis m2-6]
MRTNHLAELNHYVIHLNELSDKFPHLPFHSLYGKHELLHNQHQSLTYNEWKNEIVLEALNNLNASYPDWTYVASRLHLHSLYLEAMRNRNISQPYENFYGLIKELSHIGIYDSSLLSCYSLDEIKDLEAELNPSRDNLFTYIGLRTLSDRYLATDHQKNTVELPQERWMIISMWLMKDEIKDIRLHLVKEAYWALSHLYMTVATPTLSNAGKSYGQLSSCFIDTVDDSLQGIYDSNTDIANLSKNGGGIGVYLGKIRSLGSSIKGFKGASSGVIPWMKQLNNTAVSVDQLGQRNGAIAVYLDVWHKDVLRFLDSKLNNGDERARTHDLFTGLTLPDLFMEKVEAREDWHLFDPHEVREIMGYSLEDYYDETDGNGSFRDRYIECVETPELSHVVIPAIEIMKRILKSQLETGTPFMFYRDEVNRKNSNPHLGMIYCSNLCTEITQNQSATIQETKEVIDGKILTIKSPGDFVVCNLSSINLGKAGNDPILRRLIPIQVRMLDNVIDINTLPVLQAELTNKKYRGIGLGTFGWHHLLAKEGIKWESDEAVSRAEELYEKISFLTIQESMKLAIEKGAAPAFQGSDWQTGEYFNKRDLQQNSNINWNKLKQLVMENGIRNTYVMAVAPNSSTSIIAGSTPSIDPIFSKFYSEEKKDYKIPVTAPELSEKTTWYYKSAYLIDQHWSIRQNAARQRYIDQSISFNFYVQNSIKAKDLLDLHMSAWKSKLKTTYYVRSTSSVIEDCDSCES